MAKAVGAQVSILAAIDNQPITATMVKDVLSKNSFDVVTMVQGETSCGVWLSELAAIVRICKEHGALVIVDAVCTLSTMPMEMDNWCVDVVITGGQKGISSIPGVSMIAFSESAWSVIVARKHPIPHWCLNALYAQKFWGEHQYHYTAPVPGVLAMYEALRLICEETLENRFARHKICSEALQAGIEAMGLRLYIPAQYRLNSVVAIDIPDGINADRIRKMMVNAFNVEISGAFGLNIIRIGQMGEQCRSHNIFKTLYALGMAFRSEGYDLDVSQGMAALQNHLAGDPLRFVG